MQLFPSPSLFEPVPAVGPAVAVAETVAETHLALHPALWHAHQLARPGGSVRPSRFAELDAVLPGGGWPTQALTELLLPHPGLGELRLLAPALAAVQGAGHSLMWFDPPAAPCAWALGALGIDIAQLVVVHPRQALRGPARQRLPAADVLWALEQALKSGHVGAVLAWLPARLPADTLRRLQLAAQAHDGPAFLLRDVAARQQPSAAPLRLLLAASGPDRLRVTLIKRRGPPLAQPLDLALPAVLSAAGLARALTGRPGRVPAPVPAAASLSMAGSATQVPAESASQTGLQAASQTGPQTGSQAASQTALQTASYSAAHSAAESTARSSVPSVTLSVTPLVTPSVPPSASQPAR